MQWQILCFMLWQYLSGPLAEGLAPVQPPVGYEANQPTKAMAGHWAKHTYGISTTWQTKECGLAGDFWTSSVNSLSVHLAYCYKEEKRKGEEIKVIPNINRFISTPLLNIYQSRNHLILVVLLLHVGITCKALKNKQTHLFLVPSCRFLFNLFREEPRYRNI